MIERCLGMLGGRIEETDFVVMLGGRSALRLLDDRLPPDQAYWLRVWGARGLLWAGPGDQPDVLRSALADESWRVREMTCKIIARHGVGDLLDDVAALESDPVRRVRAAAVGAARRIVETQA